jgi:hypothetical protein
MKPELQIILNRINSLSSNSAESFNEFRNLVRRAIDVLQVLEGEDKTPVLSAWISMGLEEIKKELNNKLTDKFVELPDDRQRSELMYSRSTVSMAITNIIMNM